MISLGLCSTRQRLDLVVVDQADPAGARRIAPALNHLPDWFGAAPWVRWPPEARFMPRIVSPGLSSARNTPWLAWLPEFGCTLAKPQPNSSLGALDGQVSRPRRHTGSRRSSAGPDSPRHICWSAPSPAPPSRRATDDVLRRDQLDLVALAAQFVRIAAKISGSRSARLSVKKPASEWMSFTAGAPIRCRVSRNNADAADGKGGKTSLAPGRPRPDRRPPAASDQDVCIHAF